MSGLRRATHGRPAAPVRLVHLGLGNFFRAHQAWFTEHAPDRDDWGYAAFTGRSAEIAHGLTEQEGLYTLLVREADGDRTEVISSLSAVHPGDDLAALRRYFASPDLALVTTTVTEAGYRRDDSGDLDLSDPDVAQDVRALAADPDNAVVSTTPGRLVAGLLARRAAGAGPLALVPCDNVPENGAMVQRVVRGLAQEAVPDLVDWVDTHVSVVTTMVDRITPRATAEDRAAVLAATGVDDEHCVVTEPFAEWVLAGDFPAGRPAWDQVGATVVDDVAVHERRKLWLLNGSHSLMAYGGSIRGHETVADAVADPVVRGWVEAWWDLAQRHLGLPEAEVTDYRAALLGRFANPRIRHLLAQIAADGSQKLPIRFGPVLSAEVEAGGDPAPATRAIAAWLAHLRGHGAPVTDAQADRVAALARADLHEAAATVLGWMAVPATEDLTGLVVRQLAEFEEGAS